MKAAVLMRHGKAPYAVQVSEVRDPDVGPKDVLVRVRAAGVNPLDTMIARKEVALLVGYRTPLIMGNELAGEVEAVGAEVTRVRVGQRVMCRMPLDGIGAFAEYAAVDQDALAPIPDAYGFEEAATLSLTALTAMQALDLLEGVGEGDTVFISGGTGSLGATAIPLAAARGLQVITSGNARHEQRVRRLGAARFIDYRTQDYADVLHDVDFVIDSLGGDEMRRQLGIMRSGGTLVSLRGGPNGEFARRAGYGPLKRALFTLAGAGADRAAARRGQRYRFVFVHADGEQLDRAATILAGQNVPAQVGPTLPLAQVSEALARVDAGGAVGKIVLVP
ncbi:NADP-dependent oxidoreductase [Propionibacterium australiense]|uniref:NADP-dependent oxidoreductase n=1 Tax=Propionibacterium australiense TaxID=119981 RepID=A0A8B3FMS5_9ACTN|nr:NADP-dependent oxidoreductase [Propionibacterium australiense]RLP10724.1 NADP-dependent oxidoreductase [Propionibacterium australiense]